jgi:regulator of protease activity HflC (stomatin/prohibitin superfamily)
MAEQKPSHVAAAAGLVRPLAVCATSTSVAALALLLIVIVVRPGAVLGLFPAPQAALLIASLCLSAFGSFACLWIVLERRKAAVNTDILMRPTRGWLQTVMAVLFSLAAAGMVLARFPYAGMPGSRDAFAAASLLLLFAVPWLIGARSLGSIPEAQLPESGALYVLLMLPVVLAATQVALLIASGLGFHGLAWAQMALAAVTLLICTELLVRALGMQFLPAPNRIDARAPITSVVARSLSGQSRAAMNVADVVRSQFGMDFSRSWALRFVRIAAPPVVVLMLGVCWFLTGVTRIDLNGRGVYEQLGRVAAILPPGLHVGLPRPFGRVRNQELGVLHTVLITTNGQMPSADAATAEGPVPADANRLWDSNQPSDVSYLVAREDGQRQSFETVSASLQVLYRIGLSDEAAQSALYHEADPETLVRALTGHTLAAFFASRTLSSVLSENLGVMAGEIQSRLQAELDRLQTGITVVTVSVETIHPPAGAAPAYRRVQAAEIEAKTDIATEQGRAEATLSVARMHAHTATDNATATAAQTESTAKADLINVEADDGPYRQAPAPFLLERYLSQLTTVLAKVPLEIIDDRLSGVSVPTIDLRPPGSAGALTQSERIP